MTRNHESVERIAQRDAIEQIIRASNPDVFILGDEDLYFRNLANDLVAAGYVKADYDSKQFGTEKDSEDGKRIELWRSSLGVSPTHTRSLFHDDWRSTVDD